MSPETKAILAAIGVVILGIGYLKFEAWRLKRKYYDALLGKDKAEAAYQEAVAAMFKKKAQEAERKMREDAEKYLSNSNLTDSDK